MSPTTTATRPGQAADRLAARLLAAALTVAACDPARAAGHGSAAWALIAVLAALALWAGPMVDARPVQTSVHWYRIAARRRTTVVPVAALVIAALTDPGAWTAGCFCALLVAYLLVTDAWTRGVTAPRRRGPRAHRAMPAVASAAGTAVVFLVAQAPVSGTGWARLPAAVAVAAALACLGLALIGRRGAGR
jgi:hypothetical protein